MGEVNKGIISSYKLKVLGTQCMSGVYSIPQGWYFKVAKRVCLLIDLNDTNGGDHCAIYINKIFILCTLN